MTFFTGTVDHTPAANPAHGETLRGDTYWSHGVWDQSECNLGRVNCDPKGALWDWEDRIYRDRELGQSSRFNGEMEVQQNEEIKAALNSGRTTAALFSSSAATPGDPVPACTEQTLEKQIVPVEQRINPLERTNENRFSTKTNTRCKDLDERKLYADVQPSKWNAFFGLDNANGKRISEGVNSGKAVTGLRDNGSLEGSERMTGHHALKSTGDQTVGFLGLGGRLSAVRSEGSAKLEGNKLKSSSEAEISDSRIDLKLGNCAYVDDTAVVPVVKYASSATAPAKKQRVSPAAQVPRCQVEGCKLDLTTAKEYHRRHKVCAAHSKSPKVTVASLEQRFCQQCSRFHVLAEFDEGKRSCRRRLAGHNERRRKPQPDHFLLASGGSSFFQESRNAVHAIGDRHHLMQRQAFTNSLCDTDSAHGYGKANWSKFGSFSEPSSLPYQLQPSNVERFMPHVSQPAADKLYKLLEFPNATSMSVRGSDGAQFHHSSGSLGHGLTLSSSSVGLHGTQVSHRCTLDSDCALSLLSSHPWSSKASTSCVSLDVSPKSDLTLEQMIAENRASFAPHFSPRSSTEFQQEVPRSTNKCFPMLPNSQENGMVSTGISFPALNSTDCTQHQAPFSLMQNLDGQSILSILQANEFRTLHDAESQQTKPTIDLLTFPSAQARHMQRPYDCGLPESTSGQYADIQPLRFESSMFDAS